MGHGLITLIKHAFYSRPFLSALITWPPKLDGLLLLLLPGALLLLLMLLLFNVNSRRTLSWPPLEGGPLLGPPRGRADTDARARLLLRVADVVDADG